MLKSKTTQLRFWLRVSGISTLFLAPIPAAITWFDRWFRNTSYPAIPWRRVDTVSLTVTAGLVLLGIGLLAFGRGGRKSRKESR